MQNIQTDPPNSLVRSPFSPLSFLAFAINSKECRSGI